MKEYTGKEIFQGIAIGKIKFYKKKQKKIVRKRVEDSAQEYARYEVAREESVRQLEDLYEKALKQVGESGAEIFQVHSLMLQDEDYNDSIKNIIDTQRVNAEYAVAVTADNFSQIFASMDNEYFQARSADVKDVSERVISVLSGNDGSVEGLEEPVIVVAEDLSPSETLQLDKSKLLAFVTRQGSANSHTAILARTMGIPALVGVDVEEGLDGELGIVDGYKGKFIVSPKEEVLEKYGVQKAEDDEYKELLTTLKGKETITKSGRKVNLYANIGNVSDLVTVLKNDAEGIGLLRSEFLYLESEDFPSEEEQFKIYRQVAETMAGKKVIIRTLDIGADKQADYFQLGKETNPALGYRAIRICLTQTDIFKTQLRALYRASAYGNISIMYPMITSVEEVRKIKEISKAVRDELKEIGVRIGEVEEGIMIETPAAALISDLLAKEVDFFSIGTNDLTQYTLAIDRQNQKLEAFYNPHHEAILRLIQLTTENAHKAGIWVGICGELGADAELTEAFIKMGVDELSVSPAYVLPIRKIIREIE